MVPSGRTARPTSSSTATSSADLISGYTVTVPTRWQASPCPYRVGAFCCLGLDDRRAIAWKCAFRAAAARRARSSGVSRPIRIDLLLEALQEGVTGGAGGGRGRPPSPIWRTRRPALSCFAAPVSWSPFMSGTTTVAVRLPVETGRPHKITSRRGLADEPHPGRVAPRWHGCIGRSCPASTSRPSPSVRPRNPRRQATDRPLCTAEREGGTPRSQQPGRVPSGRSTGPGCRPLLPAPEPQSVQGGHAVSWPGP